MAAGTLSLTWRGGDSPARMATRTAAWLERLRGAIGDLARVYEAKLVDAMKNDAPWTDRTADARQGLSGTTIIGDDVITIVTYHTEEYGIWLEIANDGRYAIIMPTIDRMAPQYMAAARKLMGG